MSKRYSIAEARANLPHIVDEVDGGTPIEITRRGKPVAVVLSLARYESLMLPRTSFAEAYRAFRERHAVVEHGVDEGFAASLRDRKAGRQVDL